MSSGQPEDSKPGKQGRFVKRNPNKKKRNLFVRETNILSSARENAESNTLTPEEKEQKFLELCNNYEDLLDQSKLITKVSDRLQNKINTANSKLEEKNVELQNTIDALTEARVGRRATTYVLIIAVILFILTEAFIEPPIERKMHAAFLDPDAEFYAALGLKGILALLIKPIEMIVERTMMRRAQRQIRSERAVAAENKKGGRTAASTTA